MAQVHNRPDLKAILIWRGGRAGRRRTGCAHRTLGFGLLFGTTPGEISSATLALRSVIVDDGAVRTVALIAVILTAACGSDETQPDAPERCQDTTDKVCTREVQCDIEAGGFAAASQTKLVNDCISASKQSLDCSRVVAIVGRPEVCVADLNATSCDQWTASMGLPLPVSCKGIFLLP